MAASTGPTLTRIAYFGRLFVKYGSIALIVLIVGRTFLTAAYRFYLYVNPPPPPPPTVGFGILPPIAFPPQEASAKPKQYQLETANGVLPFFGDRAKVFLAKRTTLSLLGDQRAKQVASSYGFMFAPNVLSTSRYRWVKESPISETLEMNIENFHFSLTSDFLSRPELLAKKDFPQSPVEVVKSYVSSTVGFDRDIASASGKVTYLRALGNELSPAVSLSDADFIAVDLQRYPIEGTYRFYTEEGDRGLIYGVLTGGLPTRDQVVQLKYDYQKIDYSQVQTYPLRDINLAWQALQSGEGFIAHPAAGSTAVIREVSMGYFDDVNEQDYVQPIYVFKGDNDFLGFVPAIDPGYINPSGEGTAPPSQSP